MYTTTISLNIHNNKTDTVTESMIRRIDGSKTPFPLDSDVLYRIYIVWHMYVTGTVQKYMLLPHTLGFISLELSFKHKN